MKFIAIFEVKCIVDIPDNELDENWNDLMIIAKAVEENIIDAEFNADLEIKPCSVEKQRSDFEQ